MDRFTLSANTLSKTVKDNLADRIEVEIGDSKQRDFKPQFKIKRWDNEVNFSMRAQEEAGATMVEEDGKVKYKGRDIEVHQYEKPDAGEDGGYEFEWVLKKKPKSNVLRTTIQHKGLDFFYQPEINDAEAQASSFKGDRRTLTEIKREMRPENVVGSYAVYHKTKRDNRPDKHYKTGKAFHIYRPHAVDADGVEVWCDLDITEGELTVTVPEKFLDKASYPVVVDPTFGYTTTGGSSFKFAGNTAFGTVSPSSRTGGDFNLSEAGTLDKITAVLSSESFYNDTDNFRVKINRTDSAATGEHDEVVSIQRDSINVANSNTAYDFTAAGESLSADDYILSIFAEGAGLSTPAFFSGEPDSGYFIAFDTGGSRKDYYIDVGSHARGWETDHEVDPWIAADIASGRQYSFYATYNASSSFNPAFAHRRLLL